MSHALASGISGEVTELEAGPNAILCGLRVVSRNPRSSARSLFHVYSVENGLITEIRPYEDRAEALAAAGL